MQELGERAVHGRRLGRWLGLAVVAAVIAAYGQLVVGRPLAGYDVTTYSLPNWVEVSAALRHLRLPLWDPYRLLGAPLLANPQTAIFYPLHWILAYLPADRGQSISIVLHLAIAGFGAYYFALRALRVSPLAAIVAGAGFAVGGFAHAHAGQYEQVTSMAWIPWALVAADAALRANRLRTFAISAAALSATVALAAFAGHTQYLYMELVLVAIYALVVAEPMVRVVPVVAAEMLGLSLAAIQLLPSYLLSRDSVRAGGLGYQAAAELSLPLHLLGAMFLPHYRSQPPLPVEWWAWTPWAVLALAAAAIAACRPHRRMVALLVLSAVGVVLALGSSTPLFRPALAIVPGLSSFRVPARWLLLPSLAIPFLAAIGFDELRRGARPTRVGVAVVLLVALLGAVSVSRSGSFAPGPVALVVGVAAALAVAGAWVAVVFRPSLATILSVAVVALVVAELIAGDVGTDLHRLRMPAGSLTARSATAAALQDPADGRVLAVGGGSLDDHPRQRASLRPNAMVFDRLRSPDGYDGGLLYSQYWVAAMRRLLRNPNFDPLLTLRPQVVGPLDPQLFSELDVTRVVAADTTVDLATVLPPGSSPETSVGTIAIWETPTLGPVFLADGSQAGGTAAPAGLRLERQSNHPERLVVDLPAGVAGRTVVVSEAWATGWRSSQARVQRRDGLLLSFVAPDHAARVTLTYHQPGLLPGALVSGATLLALVALMGVAVIRR